jgi:hypothetical protein
MPRKRAATVTFSSFGNVIKNTTAKNMLPDMDQMETPTIKHILGQRFGTQVTQRPFGRRNNHGQKASRAGLTPYHQTDTYGESDRLVMMDHPTRRVGTRTKRLNEEANITSLSILRQQE